MISVYEDIIDNGITLRDEEAIKRYVQLIQWGRRNPVQFVEKIFQIPLLDYQKWLLAMSWNKEYVVWVCSRNAGKSFLVSIFAQARALLYPKSKIHIMSSGSRQANETFETMESIAKHTVKTLVSDNTVFWDEIAKSNADSDGFTHDPNKGHFCRLMNSSFIQAVVGTAVTVRGKRSNVNIYDEAGTIPRDYYDATEPFVTQSADFKTGSKYDPEVYPQEVPNMRLYVGSASDTHSLFYEKYKEGTKQMLIGNDRYFVADLICEIPLNPTMNGKKMKPLLSQEEIERKRRENEIACNREYYNIFDRFDLDDCVVNRADIIANEENFVPLLGATGKKNEHYVITYDPAAKVDNTPVLVTEITKNAKGRVYGRFVYMKNLVVTYNDGSKRPMRIDEQVQCLREIIYRFNGYNKAVPYENVTVLIDAGAGGNASAIAQLLCQEWTDKNGSKHPGLYDEDSPDMLRWAEAFPTAKPGSLKLLEPVRYRNLFFEAASRLISLGDIKFPCRAPKSDTLVLDDGTEYKLTKEELASLIQTDLMKDEMVAMLRFKTPTGKVTYGLEPSVARKMHDDRNYVAIMACWWISQQQETDTLGDDNAIDYSSFGTNSINRLTSANPGSAYWMKLLGDRAQKEAKPRIKSPFQEDNPFKNKK